MAVKTKIVGKKSEDSRTTTIVTRTAIGMPTIVTKLTETTKITMTTIITKMIERNNFGWSICSSVSISPFFVLYAGSANSIAKFCTRQPRVSDIYP